MHDKPAKPIHFPGLNELRALAALVVVFYHVERNEFRAGYASLWDSHWGTMISGLGSAGVWLFFVLSGFLITYLLLHEQRINGKVRVFDFYVRRSLRIWPLYYLVLVISFFVVPACCSDLPGTGHYQHGIRALDHDFDEKLWLFALMLPNLALAQYTPVVGASQAWSIGSEEQFYLLWPWVLILFRRRLPWAIGTIIGGKLALGLAAEFGATAYDLTWCETLARYLQLLYLEMMGLGALAAWLYFEHRPKMEPMLSSRRWQVACVALLVAMLALPFRGNQLLMGIGFAYLVLSTTVPGGICLRSRWLDWLGRMSYGIYMFHTLWLLLAMSVLHTWGLSGEVRHAAVYVLVVPATIATSWLSYRWLESPCLRLKRRFAAVASHDAPEIATPVPRPHQPACAVETGATTAGLR